MILALEGIAAHGPEFQKVPAYEWMALHSRLRHWGLLEEQMLLRESDPPKRRAGYWRVTSAGVQFLAGALRVHGILRLEEDRVVEHLGPMVDHADALAGVAKTAKIPASAAGAVDIPLWDDEEG